MILLGGKTLPHDVMESLTADGHPCVTIGNWAVPDVHLVGSVVADLRSGLRAAMGMLVEQGHRNIGFTDKKDRDKEDNFGAILAEEMAALNIPLKECNRVLVGRSLEDGAEALRSLMSRADPPTAIVSRTDVLAIGAIREAMRMGMDYGRCVGLGSR